MKNVKTQYTNENNSICEQMNMPDAFKMLQIAKERSGEVISIETAKTSKNSKKINRFRRITMVAASLAACLIISTFSVLAYTGFELKDIFKIFFNDDITPGIIDQGYMTMVEQSQSNDEFTVNFIMATGDDYNQVLMFDVVIDDSALATDTETIQMYAYVLDEMYYNTEKDNYHPFSAVGYKDSENPNLYHVKLSGAISYVENGVGIVDITRIVLTKKTGTTTREVDMTFKFNVSPSTFKETTNVLIEHQYIDANDVRYNSGLVIFTNYYTEVQFYYDTRFDYRTRDEWLAEWEQFISEVNLVVDGVEYSPYIGDEMSGWNEKAGMQKYPPVDYENARDISLVGYDQIMYIKIDGLFQDMQARCYSKESEYITPHGDNLVVHNNLELTLKSACLGNYGCCIMVAAPVPSDLSADEASTYLAKEWSEVRDNSYLYADGMRIDTADSWYSGAVYVFDGDKVEYLNMIFEGFDHLNAKNVIFVLDGKEITIR